MRCSIAAKTRPSTRIPISSTTSMIAISAGASESSRRRPRHAPACGQAGRRRAFAARAIRKGVPVAGTLDVLFLCTGNSARSILAEAILRRNGAPRFRAHSAGSRPRGTVHPLALRVLARSGYPTEGLRSKSWDLFAGADAPRMDLVITVCDSAAGEACPLWPGQPVTAHWSIADPAAVEGSEAQQEAAFVAALEELTRRITILLGLPLARLDERSLRAALRETGG
jgi:arsenate reductase